jgi:hypothetical protein
MKLQSSLEFLMTYGWVILIVSLLAVILFWLGVFGHNSGPRVQPGGCYVNRPFGPNSTIDVTLEGTCDNTLPEFVLSFNGNGAASAHTTISAENDCAVLDICVGARVPFNDRPHCNYTIVAWSYDTGMGSAGVGTTITYRSWRKTQNVPGTTALGGVLYLVNKTSPTFDSDAGIEYNNTVVRYEASGLDAANFNEYFISGNFKDKWIMTAISVSNSIATAYLNGTAVSPKSPYVGCAYLDQIIVGEWDREFNGTISNVQIYNVSLSANQIQSLYAEGLGGIPADVQNIVVWWPLNGNTQDYSGTGTNGAASLQSYSSTYPQPP